MKEKNLAKTAFDTVAIILIAMFIGIGATRCNEAHSQEDTLACTDGTRVIIIKLPGMCPVGFYPL